jgi:hypothetical protein
MKYYIFFNNQRLGPYSINEINSLKLPDTTPVWSNGMAEWSTIAALHLEDSTEKKKINNDSISNYQTPSNNPREDFPSNKPKNSTPLIRTIIISSIVLLSFLGVLYYLYHSQNSTSTIPVDSLAYNSESDQPQTSELSEKPNQSANPRPTTNNLPQDETIVYRENWPSYITSSNNEYLYSDLGGISSLEISLNNNTPYMLDEVIVSVDYVKTNGGVFKTETLYFNNVKPNSISYLPAPNSPRGTSVNHYILGVQSTEMKLHFPR